MKRGPYKRFLIEKNEQQSRQSLFSQRNRAGGAQAQDVNGIEHLHNFPNSKNYNICFKYLYDMME